MKPQRVDGYLLSNGSIVAEEQIVTLAQKELDFRNAISEFICNEVSYINNQDTVEQFIFDNVDELKTIFKILD
jgi:hypothetical protein